MKKMNEQDVRQATGGWTYRYGLGESCPWYSGDVQEGPKYCYTCNNYVETGETTGLGGAQIGGCKEGVWADYRWSK